MKSTEKKVEKLVIIGVIVVAVVVLAVAAHAMTEFMHQPESCSKMCHEMQPFYDSLDVSTHGIRGVMDCHECHRPEGAPIGHGIDHIKGIEASEIEDEIPESPKSEFCLECHGGAKYPGAKYPEGHKVHVSWMGERFPEYSGYECITCHDDHKLTVRPETCTICHPISK